jgi:hypothetical protein
MRMFKEEQKIRHLPCNSLLPEVMLEVPGFFVVNQT